MNLLFICSRNQWRSPTAERIWRKSEGISARSAGTSPKARRTVRHGDILWADIIFVMEDKHANRLRAMFRQDVAHKRLYVLGIPDAYRFMDPELVDELTSLVTPVLDEQSD